MEEKCDVREARTALLFKEVRGVAEAVWRCSQEGVWEKMSDSQGQQWNLAREHSSGELPEHRQHQSQGDGSQGEEALTEGELKHVCELLGSSMGIFFI